MTADAAVLVVTRNPALAMGLQRHGYDVADVRPDAYGDWTREAASVAVVVLELPDAVAAEAAVQRLRSGRNGVPVLLVSNTSPGWETVAGHADPGTRVLPLPISLPALLGAVGELAAAGPIEVTDPPPWPADAVDAAQAAAAAAPEPVVAEEPQPDPVVAVAPAEVEPEFEPVGLGVEPVDVDPAGDALYNEVAASVGLPAAPVTYGADPAALPAEVPVGFPGSPDEAAGTAEPPAGERPADEPPAGEPTPEPTPEPAPDPAPARPAPTGLVDLAAALAERVREFNTVADCAEVAAEELADRVGAEATACLVPDGNEWRVAGGRNLHPLEPWVNLNADHWLIRTAVDERRAVVVPESERAALHGAPLATWRHVLVVPLPDVRGVLVAARAEEPFAENAVEQARDVVPEATALLTEAVAARALARALLPFADLAE
ncbi:MAG TPA: hypothetical protein VNA20_02125 [Frankiaceae bacterium]|nr:hypothetical protein [Frankiaceae bacterium]